jgi:hypothetical protein
LSISERVSLEVYILLACGAAKLGDGYLMFQDSIVVSSSRVEMSNWCPTFQDSMVVSYSTVEMSTVSFSQQCHVVFKQKT